MMRSLYAAVSGLKGNQTYMDVIGNNIANVNTVGYKSSNVTFQDMLSQTLQGASSASGTRGGTNPMQVGLGVSVGSISTNFTDGSTQPTGISTNLAISGDGFFVVGTPTNQMYTRSGDFTTDEQGNFLNSAGYSVLGWPADASGVVDTTQPISALQIPVGSTMPAKVSTAITLTGNLNGGATALNAATMKIDAAAAVVKAGALTTAISGVTGVAPATTTAVSTAAAKVADANAAAAALAAATPNTTAAATAAAAALDAAKAAVTAANAAVKAIAADPAAKADAATTAAAASLATAASTISSSSDSTQPVSYDLYDTQGNKYTLTGTITKTGNNSWTFTPASTIIGGTDGKTTVATVTGGSSTIKFNADGKFDTSTVFNALTIDPTGGPYAGAGSFTVQPSGSTMTQNGTDSTAKMSSDGYGAGTLNGKTISTTGEIIGSFTNGQTQAIGQVALAVFNNPDGLLSAGGNLYTKTTNSGEPQIGKAGTGGRGKFTPGSLEMSNVDLAQQFTNMIVAQRAFQANSKIITTDDNMLEELVNLKR
ncbi:flagellar hook protein FlgE [Pelosinus baikalensis]|uniref:Flagellar hook protein FlgE n=1 Tax=Pelosinus baikalensis TaxID=2892015 RepID=A0ABS8HQW1_9FIRM|nr:flagellar hook protein FlgE [Pelosinus baikalensis]MCC5464954.1 flagellar hook protein FlgE [Pelosinus baikalensis]